MLFRLRREKFKNATSFYCFYTGVGGREVRCVRGGGPLVLISGSSKIVTGNVGRLIEFLHPLKSVIIVTPSSPHSNDKYTLAIARPIRCRLIGGRIKLAICGYAKAPASYVGLTHGAILSQRPSLIIKNVGRKSGSTAGVRCSNAVKIIIRNYLGNVPSVNFSLYGRSRSTSFRTAKLCMHGVSTVVLRGKLPPLAYLGIGFPGATSVGKVEVYRRTGKH